MIKRSPELGLLLPPFDCPQTENLFGFVYYLTTVVLVLRFMLFCFTCVWVTCLGLKVFKQGIASKIY